MRASHLALAASALLLLWIGQYSDLDLALADWMSWTMALKWRSEPISG